MARQQFGRLLFVGGFIGWYALPALLAALNPEQVFGRDLPATISPQTVLVALGALSLFFLSWATSYAFLTRNDNESNDHRPPALAVSRGRLYLLLAGAALIGLLPYILSEMSPTAIIATIVESRAVVKPWSYNENLGNQTSALLYLGSSFLAAAACLSWITVLDRRLHPLLRAFCSLMALALTLLIYFDQGTRSVTVLVLLPALLLLFMRLRRRSRASFVLAILLTGAVLVFLLQFQLLFRTNYTRGSVNDLLLEDWTTFGGTSDYFSETLFAIHIVPKYHDFFRESALLQFVVSPIPRFIWEDKPATQVTWFYTLMRWGIDIYSESGNVFPGIVGQYYMSWGWFGPIIIGFIMAWFTRLADRLLLRTDSDRSPYRFLLGAMLATWILITYRFLSPGFLYPVLIVAGLLWLSRMQEPAQLTKKPTAPTVAS